MIPDTGSVHPMITWRTELSGWRQLASSLGDYSGYWSRFHFPQSAVALMANAFRDRLTIESTMKSPTIEFIRDSKSRSLRAHTEPPLPEGIEVQITVSNNGTALVYKGLKGDFRANYYENFEKARDVATAWIKKALKSQTRLPTQELLRQQESNVSVALCRG